MKISWKWLNELVDLSSLSGPEACAELLTARGIEVEELTTQAAGFEQVVIVEILSRDKHPDSDRLSLCKVSLGSGSTGSGGQSEPLEIVCGAQNMKAGDRVALAQIGAKLPNGLKIEKSKIRGVVSNGMLCSEAELGIAKEADGIMILPKDAPLGMPLAKFLGRDDVIFFLKLTANRADCLSHFGIARELASALGVKPKRPAAPAAPTSGSPISVTLDAGADGLLFLGCTVEGVKVGPSPEWVVKRLEAIGGRSINNIVDATNLVLHELGHPVHAYDASLLRGSKLSIANAKAGVKLPLLDGTEITLSGTELVIADAEGPVGLAGVMGGGNSEVRESTTKVFLECAEFAPSRVRRASTLHGKRTEASHRFERGVDGQSAHLVLARLAALVVELAGGKVTGGTQAYLPGVEGSDAKAQSVFLPKGFISEFLGADYTDAEIVQTLSGIDCKVEPVSGGHNVFAPSYRKDLTIKEDLADEIGRCLGYARIKPRVPALTTMPGSDGRAAQDVSTERGPSFWSVHAVKSSLAGLGLAESINLGLCDQEFSRKLGIEPEVKLLNPLSAELGWMPKSLLPALIQNAVHNKSHHFGSETLSVRLFEVRPVFSLEGGTAPEAQGQLKTGVREDWKVGIAIMGARLSSGLEVERGEIDFYDLKAVLEGLLKKLGSRGVRLSAINERSQLPAMFHPGQSAVVLAGKDIAGHIGRLHPSHETRLKLKAPLWMGELNLTSLLKLSRPVGQAAKLQPWSEFPGVERDFALLVKGEVTAEQLSQVALKAGRPLAKIARIFDVYRGAQVAEGMTSVTVRVIFSEEGRSLVESEADQASQKILEAWRKELEAELRG